MAELDTVPSEIRLRHSNIHIPELSFLITIAFPLDPKVHQDMPIAEAGEDTMWLQAHITPDLGSSKVKWSIILKQWGCKRFNRDFRALNSTCLFETS